MILLTFLGKYFNAPCFNYVYFKTKGLSLISERSYAFFGTKLPVFGANNSAIKN